MFLQHSFPVFLMLLALIVVSESTHRKQRVDPKCGQGWRAYGKIKCFKLIEGKLSQEEGAERCAKEQGTTLAKIANKVEQRFITREYLAEINAANPKEEVSVWTDGKRDSSADCGEGVFKWEDGIEVDEHMVPSGRSMGKNCLTLAMRASGNESNASQWLAHRCEDKADYVLCEKAYPLEQIATVCKPAPTPRPAPRPTPSPRSPFVCKGTDWLPVNADGCFKGLGTRREPYHDAVNSCNEAVSASEVRKSGVSSRLAIIKTAEEQAKLKHMLDESLDYSWFGREYWLGARRVPGTSHFRWNDGSEMSWANWASNEPAGSESGADCVALFTYNFIARWQTTKCHYGYIPLCQKRQE